MQLLTHLYGGVAVAQLNSLMASETIDKTTIAMDGAATLRYLQIVLLPPAQIASSNSLNFEVRAPLRVMVQYRMQKVVLCEAHVQLYQGYPGFISGLVI